MPTLTIDGRKTEVAPGTTVLEAARGLGLDIPALCHAEGCEPNTSCMACVVRVQGRRGLVPSCATEVVDGMEVESESEAVRDARRTAIELLLGDHVGDCHSPCQSACPAHMDISKMIEQIERGQLEDAVVTVKRDIALPATLGRICAAPCEPGCRRSAAGGPVAVCSLKRFVADAEWLEGRSPHVPTCDPATGQRVAVVGAGPAGLGAAYDLKRRGHAVTVFDRHDKPGGSLRTGTEPGDLPREVLDREIDVIARMGVVFEANRAIDDERGLDTLLEQFRAVVLATGALDDAETMTWGLARGKAGLTVDPSTCLTSRDGVFAAGSVVQRTKLAVRAMADGRAAAVCVDQFLEGRPVQAPSRLHNLRLGRLEGEVLDQRVADLDRARGDRVADTDALAGLTLEQAVAEARRCLHCDCAGVETCKLKHYAEAYGANPRRFAGEVARPVGLRVEHPFVRYEPGKCISCGLCVQIARREGESLGVTFVGRGFSVRVDVPWNSGLAEGLQQAASQCVAACPTGALSMRGKAATTDGWPVQPTPEADRDRRDGR
jgi:ferredoxin